MQLYLASTSPRRAALLKQIGIAFSCFAIEIDESVNKAEAAKDYVLRMAQEKSAAAWRALANPHACILTADTIIELDGQVLGKPCGREDAIATLQRLSGREHWVHTAISLRTDTEHKSCVVSSKVEFRHLTHDEITLYWQTGEPSDKAGSYAIQGLGASFVTHIDGSYSAIVGLPLAQTVMLLQQLMPEEAVSMQI